MKELLDVEFADSSAEMIWEQKQVQLVECLRITQLASLVASLRPCTPTWSKVSNWTVPSKTKKYEDDIRELMRKNSSCD